MPDYQGNSKKDKREGLPEKKVERVTTGEVLIQKKSLGTKVKDLFVADSIRNVRAYVWFDVLLPAMRDMLFDAVSQGTKRMMYGSNAAARGGYRTSHVTYNNPVRRMGYGAIATQDNLDRRGLPPSRPDITRRSSVQNTSMVLATKEEAETILEQMGNIIDQYDWVTVGDLYNMVGMQSTPVDEKWGWIDIRMGQVQQIREGYLLDLPQPQPLQ